MVTINNCKMCRFFLKSVNNVVSLPYRVRQRVSKRDHWPGIAQRTWSAEANRGADESQKDWKGVNVPQRKSRSPQYLPSLDGTAQYAENSQNLRHGKMKVVPPVGARHNETLPWWVNYWLLLFLLLLDIAIIIVAILLLLLLLLLLLSLLSLWLLESFSHDLERTKTKDDTQANQGGDRSRETQYFVLTYIYLSLLVSTIQWNLEFSETDQSDQCDGVSLTVLAGSTAGLWIFRLKTIEWAYCSCCSCFEKKIKWRRRRCYVWLRRLTKFRERETAFIVPARWVCIESIQAREIVICSCTFFPNSPRDDVPQPNDMPACKSRPHVRPGSSQGPRSGGHDCTLVSRHGKPPRPPPCSVLCSSNASVHAKCLARTKLFWVPKKWQVSCH